MARLRNDLKVRCPYCGREYFAKGLKGHIRMVHDGFFKTDGYSKAVDNKGHILPELIVDVTYKATKPSLPSAKPSQQDQQGVSPPLPTQGQREAEAIAGPGSDSFSLQVKRGEIDMPTPIIRQDQQTGTEPDQYVCPKCQFTAQAPFSKCPSCGEEIERWE